MVVSLTVSGLAYALVEVAFLTDAHRLNVAISRSRLKLIVVGSSALLRLLPADLEVFQQAHILKALRFLYCRHPLWSGEIGGVPARATI